MKRILITALLSLLTAAGAVSQINTDQILRVGRNALYFEDYVLSIQYFNQVIAVKPYLAQPYFFRALAKLNLDDYRGAEEDATIALEHNPFITDAYELRGVARQNLGKTEDAIADYDHALSMLPNNRGILFNKALAQQELKKYDEATASFDLLLKTNPSYDNGYLGRARLFMEKGDTVSAIADIDKALELNKNSVNAYVMRADIAINSSRNYQQALDDMNEAIRLQPHYVGFFINRAFLRHRLDDYFGAMSDFDYAIQLDPLNYIAIYNRALLRAEVHDYDKAIEDLNRVLAIKGRDYRAIYNRAVIQRERGFFKEALADVNTVIEAFPDLAAAYFLRSDIKRAMGDRTSEKDYTHSLALAKENVHQSNAAAEDNDVRDLFETDNESQDVVAARFTSLRTIDDNASVEQEYNNKNIRGKVQDRNMNIDMEPMFFLTYYTSPTELKPSSDYLKEVDEVNNTRTLRYMLQVTNHEPSMTDADEINRHFESIDYYNSYLATHTPRAIDYFGRAMDFMTLHNYPSAIEDFTRAIAATPDFTLAYLMRAVAGLNNINAPEVDKNTEVTSTDVKAQRLKFKEIIDDIDKVIELSPSMAIAYYNKGVILAGMQDLTSALNLFTRAIELDPEFGEAYYNRGYVYMNLGNREAGTADLSKAGELGIVPSYSLLKRMNR